MTRGKMRGGFYSAAFRWQMKASKSKIAKMTLDSRVLTEFWDKSL